MAFKPLRTFTNRVGVTFDENRTQVVYAEDLNDIKESLEFLYENIGAIEDWIARVPTGLTITIVSETAINLSWTNVDTTGDGVKVERSTDGVTFVEIASLVLGVNTYSDTGLTQGTEYFYRIKSYKGASSSNYTSIISEFTTSSKYSAVYNAMTSKPVGNDIKYQNRWVSKIYKIAGSKVAYLLNLACHNSQASLLNWHAPGSQNPSLLGTPAFTAYKGFLGSSGGSNLVRTNYIPSTHSASLLGQNNISMLTAVHESASFGQPVFGSQSTSAKSIRLYANFNNYNYFRLNNVSNISDRSTESRRYFTISRQSATEAEVYKNKIKLVYTSNSDGLCDTEMWLSGTGSTGAVACTMPLFVVAQYLTQNEINQIIDANEEYLNNYSMKIRPFSIAKEFNVLVEGHSFMSNALVGDAIMAKINALRFNNISVGGAVVSQLVTRGATLDAFLQTETANYKNVTALYIGVNEVTNTAGTGTTAYNNLKAYVQTRLSAGHRMFVYTMTPATAGGLGAGFETERGIFNGLLRSDLANLANCYILDTDTKTELTNVANTTYFVDGLHPTWQGSAIMGQLLLDKLTALYG